MTAAPEFFVLGPFEVRRDGAPVAITAPKRRALLTLLLLRANEPVPQDQLIEMLWDGDAPRTARASLQNQIHALRKTLGPDVVERQPAGYVLHVEPGRLDLHRFDRLVEEARHCVPRERASKLREALACWRGPALTELRASAQGEIARLEEERLTALEDRLDADLDLGRHAALVPELEQLVARRPLRERFWAQLMLALYRGGRQADALAAYRRAHHAFTDELGIEPGVVLRDLQRRILVQDPVLDDPERRLGSMLERAAAILPRQPRERAESLYEYGSALMRIGERRQAAATLQAAERLAATTGEHGLEQRARMTLSHLSIFTEGRTAAEHLATVEDAARVCERFGDDGCLAQAYWHRAYVLWSSGLVDDAARWAQQGIELAVRGGDEFREAVCRAKLAQCLATGSTPVDRAIAGCEKQLEAACWGTEGPVVILSALAFLYAQAGRLTEARALIERELTSVRQTGAVWNLVRAIFWAGMAERAAGNLEGAAAHLRTAQTMLEAENDRSFLGDSAGHLACVLALCGEPEEARRLASVARRVAHSDDHAVQTLWRRALALAAAHQGQAEEAMQLSEEALARTRGSEWLTFHGETLEEAATIQELLGDPGGGERALCEALATFERKGNAVGAQRVRERLSAVATR